MIRRHSGAGQQPRRACRRQSERLLGNGVDPCDSEEVAGNGAFLFDIPACYTPQSTVLPTEAEVEPWLKMIVRLWDDEEFLPAGGRGGPAACAAVAAGATRPLLPRVLWQPLPAARPAAYSHTAPLSRRGPDRFLTISHCLLVHGDASSGVP